MRICNCGFEHTDCLICLFADFDFENKAASCHHYGKSVKIMRFQNTYELSEGILRRIEQCLNLPEMGGILGADINDKCNVTTFHFDSTGQTEKNCYTPDVDALNKIIQDWAKFELYHPIFPIFCLPKKEDFAFLHHIESAGLEEDLQGQKFYNLSPT